MRNVNVKPWGTFHRLIGCALYSADGTIAGFPPIDNSYPGGGDQLMRNVNVKP